MAGRPRILTLPFLGRLSDEGSGSSRITELEAGVIGLFDQMQGRILRYALSFGLPVADAEEVRQDVFLALYQHLLNGKSSDRLSGWLFRVTHNLSLKRRLVITQLAGCAMTADTERESMEIADPQPGPEDQFAFRQRQDRLRSVVDALPEMDRQCLHLRAEGLRYREIASVLGVSVGSVANSLARSLARLLAAEERLR